MLNENQILLQLASKHEVLNSMLSKLPIQITSSNSETLRFDEYGHCSSAFSMSLNNLTYFNFRDNKKGNLIDLIERFSKKSRTEVISEMYMAIMMTEGLSDVEYEHTDYEYKLEYPEEYEENSLDVYPKKISRLFLNDNVWITTQDYWGIRYDHKRKRVIIPVYQDGGLVGAIGRINKTTLDPFENKYMPTLVYNKTRVLFGLDEFRDRIKQIKKVILVESEKSVLKAWQYKLPIPVLAVGCSNISRHHIERLNLLGVETIVWCQDKGIKEKEVLKNNMNRLSMYSNAKSIKYFDSDSCELLEDKECLLDRDLDFIKKALCSFVKDIKELGVKNG